MMLQLHRPSGRIAGYVGPVQKFCVMSGYVKGDRLAPESVLECTELRKLSDFL